MQNLPKSVLKSAKRIGRGIGSGKGGHTVGKGQKGQKTRAKLSVIFQGYKVKKSFIKKLPFMRGKGKFKAGASPAIVQIGALEVLSKGSVVDVETLIKEKIVSKSAAKFGVKILGKGELTKALTIKVSVSASAVKKVEKAGGKVELEPQKVEDNSK